MIFALPARAKLNLDLEVVGRREDGFHELKTTFQAIDLHDLLEIAPASSTSFSASGFAIDNENNSVIKAHRAIQQAAGTTLPVNIHLHKRIPPGSGMGGASSDAAATLNALQRMFNLKLDLEPIAEHLGSDVRFFLTGGRAHAEGRGEVLTPEESKPEWFAIAWPGFALATADVYRAWDEVRGDSNNPNHLRRAAEYADPRLKDFATLLGQDWQLTGSGSAFFQKTKTKREAEVAIRGLDCWTAVAAAVQSWA